MATSHRSTRPPLVLASASPQRREILSRIGVDFTVRPSGVAELELGDAKEVALQNALLKARAAARLGAVEPGAVEPGAVEPGAAQPGAARPGAVEAVLGADTLVELNGTIYGKPADEDAARRTLQALGGATHNVHTGVALLLPEGELTAVASTAVTFRPLERSLLERCLRSGQWREKSGAYAIQGFGAALVRRIEGDYENVVGLPVATLLDLWPDLLGS